MDKKKAKERAEAIISLSREFMEHGFEKFNYKFSYNKQEVLELLAQAELVNSLTYNDEEFETRLATAQYELFRELEVEDPKYVTVNQMIGFLEGVKAGGYGNATILLAPDHFTDNECATYSFKLKDFSADAYIDTGREANEFQLCLTAYCNQEYTD